MYEYVLGLEVAVNDHLGVQFPDAVQYLFEDQNRLLLCYPALAVDVILQ